MKIISTIFILVIILYIVYYIETLKRNNLENNKVNNGENNKVNNGENNKVNNIKNKVNNIKNKVNNIKNKVNNIKNKVNSKKQNIEGFNIYCNEINNEKYDFFSKKTIVGKHLNKINTVNIPKYLYTSESTIPYNFNDKLDNNVIYNLNLKKKERVHGLEKYNYGGIMPKNTNVLLKNYNENLDQFLVDNETPVKYRYKDCKKIPKYEGSVCSIKDLKINLLGRYKKYKLHVNWDLPVNCLDIEECYFFYKREKDETSKYKAIKIKYNNKSEEKIFDLGKLVIYKDFANIKFNFFFKKSTTYNCFIYLKYGDKETYSNLFDYMPSYI
jgi:hypothetical protein